jgi:dTDP-4-amino-4,6-dideoxygalactose transaminase
VIPLAKAIVTEEQKKAVLRVLESGSYILGENNEKLEQEFARYCGVKYGVTVNSGTAALHLSLLALGIGNGDEVITVSHTYVATANVILFVGAKPVFVDIDPETYTMDPDKLEKCITQKTRAIIPVHLYGHPADMDPILEIAKKHDLCVVEDACQAHGALYNKRRVGSLGDVACFSFYPSKNMTVCGDGGIIVTKNEDVMEKLKILRNQGQRVKNLHECLGFNMRLSEIHACIARVQLKHLNEWNITRRKNAAMYNSLLADIKKVKKPIERKWAGHVYHYYVIRYPKRDELKEYLTSKRIGVGIHYPTPIHLQPIYKERFRFSIGGFPVTEEIANEVLSLPCHPMLSLQNIEFIADSITEFVEGKK